MYEEIAVNRGNSETPGEDILAMLMSARDETGAGLSDQALHDEILTLLVAGHETTATTLAWGLHHLMETPAVGQRLHRELEAAFPDGMVAPERVRDLEYLQAVVNEILRITPIAVAVPRRLIRPAQIAGYDLPAGTLVAASIYLAHRSERNWEYPDDFVPERFLTGRTSPFAFLPFGGDPRRCVGAAFAHYQIAVMLAQLWLHWRLEPVAGFRVRPYMRGVTVAPSPRMPALTHRRRAPLSRHRGQSRPSCFEDRSRADIGMSSVSGSSPPDQAQRLARHQRGPFELQSAAKPVLLEGALLRAGSRSGATTVVAGTMWRWRN